MVIVGSGIHGATIALEAVRAGYSVALCERGDFGHATSANSLKIIHGGIRYLQHGDLKRMRESIVSRRSMMRFAPHLVKPLPCLMPTYGHGIRGREMMRLAFVVYDAIACDRNKGLERGNHLPACSAVSIDECRAIVPGIREKGLSGGAVWYDAMSDNSERLVLEYVKEAARYGAAIGNYSEVVRIETTDSKVSAVVVRDCGDGSRMRLGCRAVVNAAGPWLHKLSAGGDASAARLWTTAVNIIVEKNLFKNYAVGLEGYTDFIDEDALIKRGKRLFFFVPWQKKFTMIGTTYKPFHGAVESFSMKREEIAEILDDINIIYPPAKLAMKDVTFFHGGLLPMKESHGKQTDSVQLDKSSKIIDHGLENGVKGLYSINGVKYTTAPDIADKVIKELRKKHVLGSKSSGSYRFVSPRRADFTAVINRLGNDLYSEIRDLLRARYGGAWREVFAYLVADDDLGRSGTLWVSEEPPLLLAEIYYFIGEEMAVNLADVVFRRSGLASAKCPQKEVLSRIADVMGDALGWRKEERVRQVADVVEVFSQLDPGEEK